MISHVMTLANGIIGVSVLAMPFCFKQCGIILATLVLLLSSLLSRMACHFLIKSAVMSRRRNFEFLAFHAFGPMGKFLAELCIIGFLLGTCIAFFVVVGDLGPQIVGEMIDRNPESIRTSLLITTGIFIVLPLGLLKNIDSLASVSTASIAFYICLALKVVAESTHHIFAGDWFDKVYYWRVGGMLQCLPIFALALFCQTQLFEIYETMPNASLEKMNEVVQKALNICTIVYISVGIFGNIAFCNQPFTGNILMSFEPSMTSEVIKIGFVLSVAFSFPLVIFPCRASLNSLLFRRGYAHEISSSYITEARFRCLTTFIVVTSLIIGVLIPNIELVLGIVGSTIGVIICLIFPAAFFISISTKNTNERLLAQFIVIVGVWIMVLGTYANLYAMEKSSNTRASIAINFPEQLDSIPHDLINDKKSIKLDNFKPPESILDIKDASKKPQPQVPDKIVADDNVRKEPPVPIEAIHSVRKEPPVPVEADNSVRKEPPVPVELIEPEKKKDNKINNPVESAKIEESVDQPQDLEDKKLIQEANKAFDSLKKIKENNDVELKAEELKKENQNIDSGQKSNDVIAVDAIKKEESELAADKELNVDSMQRREQLEKTLEKHIMQEKNLMEEQKQLLKDIEQKKKEIELAKKLEKDQEKTKKLENIENENNVENQKIVNKLPIIQNLEANVNLETIKKKDKLPIINSTKLTMNIENSVNSIPNNKNQILSNLNQDEKNINKKKDELVNEKNKNEVLDSEVKKPKNSMMSVLTKKSNIHSNENETNDKKNIIEAKNHKPGPKINNFKPIAIKMNNKTMTLDVDNKVNNTGIKKNILEPHQRLKREESDIFEIEDKNIKNNENNAKATEVIQEEKVCEKAAKKLNIENDDGIFNKSELINKESSNIIKESIHLSGQDIVKKVSPESILPQDDSFVNVKKRDLKALKIDRNRRKK